MKDGVLFVNNKNFDEVLNLRKQFKISNEDFNLIQPEDIIENDPDNQNVQMSDFAIIYFDNKMVEKYQTKLKFTPYIISDNSYSPFKWLDKNSVWTTDNFGPLKIPSNCYFVLGDNRHNSQDSRYFGFVKKEDIKGVMSGSF